MYSGASIEGQEIVTMQADAALQSEIFYVIFHYNCEILFIVVALSMTLRKFQTCSGANK